MLTHSACARERCAMTTKEHKTMVCYKCGKVIKKPYLYEWHCISNSSPKPCHFWCAPKAPTETQEKACNLVERMLTVAEVKDKSWEFLKIERKYLAGEITLEDVYGQISKIKIKMEQYGHKMFAQQAAWLLVCNTEKSTRLLFWSSVRLPMQKENIE